MRCRQAQRWFGNYADALLSAQATQELEAHLHACACCARQWRRYQQTVRMLQDLPAVSMSELGCQRLKRELAVARPGVSGVPIARPKRRIMAAAVAASAVLVAYVGWQQWQPATSPEPQVRFAQPQASTEALVLRDAESGGWIAPEALAAQLKRSDEDVAIVPRLRVDASEVEPLLRRQQRHVAELLRQRDLGPGDVHFLAPVTIGGSLLDGPPVEWWVMRPRTPEDVAFGR